MIIQNSTFTIFFPTNDIVRESIFELEKHFNDFKKPFTLITVPTDTPAEFPRIITSTPKDHSKLAICGNNVQLKTIYDNNYENDIKLCLDYTTNKVKQIISAIPIIEGVPKESQRVYYSGLSMDVLFGQEDGVDNPLDFVYKHHIKDDISLPMDEVQYRLALIHEDKYYVNIIMQNQKVFIGRPDERGSFAGLKRADDQLLVSIDINDRYAFNNKIGYVSDSENIIRLASIMEEFVSEYLAGYISTGVLNYAAK